METDYKFYLSLENSLCRDYVTEKYFSMMRYNVVPVVMSSPLDSHSLLSPSHSFIDALHFPSVGKLAKYLHQLAANDTLYNEYFWWKPHFQVHSSEQDVNRGMCHLCAELHSNDQPKIYANMTDWWDSSAGCRSVHA